MRELLLLNILHVSLKNTDIKPGPWTKLTLSLSRDWLKFMCCTFGRTSLPFDQAVETLMHISCSDQWSLISNDFGLILLGKFQLHQSKAEVRPFRLFWGHGWVETRVMVEGRISHTNEWRLWTFSKSRLPVAIWRLRGGTVMTRFDASRRVSSAVSNVHSDFTSRASYVYFLFFASWAFLYLNLNPMANIAARYAAILSFPSRFSRTSGMLFLDCWLFVRKSAGRSESFLPRLFLPVDLVVWPTDSSQRVRNISPLLSCFSALSTAS